MLAAAAPTQGPRVTCTFLLWQAHRQLAKVHHPDKVAGLEPESVEQAKQQMQRLNWAKERMLEKLESSWVPTRRRKGTPKSGRD